MIERYFWTGVARLASRARGGAARLERAAIGRLPAPPLPSLEPARLALREVWRPPSARSAPTAGVLARYAARFADEPPVAATLDLVTFLGALAEDRRVGQPAVGRLLRLVLPPAYGAGACAIASRSFVRFWTDEETLLVLRGLFPDIAARLDQRAAA